MVWTRENYNKEESQEQINKERIYCRSMLSSSGWIQAQDLKKKKKTCTWEMPLVFTFWVKIWERKKEKEWKRNWEIECEGPHVEVIIWTKALKHNISSEKKKLKKRKRAPPLPLPVCTGGAGVSGNGLDYIANNGTEMWERKRGTRDESVRGNTLKRVKIKNRRGREKPYEATISDWVWLSDCGGIFWGNSSIFCKSARPSKILTSTSSPKKNLPSIHLHVIPMPRAMFPSKVVHLTCAFN